MVIINKDGKKVVISGSSVQITDGKMFVDGKEFNIKEIGNIDSSNPNKYEIIIQGEIDKLKVNKYKNNTMNENVRKIHTK